MEQREQTASEERKGILSLPPEERPYEKCLEQGCQALSDAELLAVIIRTGAVGDTSVDLARRVLDLGGRQGNLAGLCGLSVQELTSVKGIGRVKAIQIQCIAELSRRMAKSRARDGLCFHDPASIADFYMEDLRHEEREQCRVMMLNTRSMLLAEKQLSVGTVNASLISAREIFLEALKCQAVYIILIHNHPSGDPHPSREDILLTKRVWEAGELIGISLLDHIIIGDRSYVSLREENLM
ncbi:DNA repair protein RadC [Oscillospiraceae bacterium Marseille-Q3528]|nr:DNA repair protein RadC [Oscillospiraceae bacterium Marseille-Q3528]